jgi:hypothetical protein
MKKKAQTVRRRSSKSKTRTTSSVAARDQRKPKQKSSIASRPTGDRPPLASHQSLDYISAERSFLHDLANPLAISAGMIEALLESGSRTGQFNPEQLRKLNKAREAIHRLGDLLNHRRKVVIELHEQFRKTSP